MLCELLQEYKKYLMNDGRMMIKLDKARYGCIEPAKLWCHHLEGILEELGFIPYPEEDAALTVEMKICSVP